MRLTVVGGGSTYTPELVDGIAGRRASLDVDEIVLVDPDIHRLRIVGPFCQRLLDHAGHPAKVLTTTNLVEGVEGASAVLLQLRVGGQKARRSDETFPHVCGCIGQETTGAGGLAKALRTVPVVLDIAETVRRVAGEDTWIVNFTNPVGIVTRALLEAGHKAVGLCNVAIGLQRKIAGWLGVGINDVRLEHLGLNHLTWERGIYVSTPDGETNRLADLLGDQYGPTIAEEIGQPLEWMRRMDAIPSYYLKYYYGHDEVYASQLVNPPRADVVTEVENELLKIYSDPSVVTKPESLAKRGGAYYSEAAVQLVHALTSGGEPEEHVVNVRNNGALPFLPADAVIEVPAMVNGSGAVAKPIRPVEQRFAGLISHVTSYEYLALEAALKGGRDRVADALLAHPLVGQFTKADRLADELVAANRGDLPWARV
jgi:6-phospho-beta-glucosidase